MRIITGELTLTAADLELGQLEVPEVRSARESILAYTALWASVCLYVLTRDPHYFVYHFQVTFFIALILVHFAFLAPYLRVRALRAWFKRMPSERRQNLYQFGPIGLIIENTLVQKTIRYEAILHYAEGNASFFIYPHPHIAETIPKRAFAPSDVAEIRRILEAKIAARRPERNLAVWGSVVGVSLMIVVLVVLQHLSVIYQ